MLLPLIALVIRRRMLKLCRVFLTAGIFFLLFFLLRDYKGFYPRGSPDQFFYMGNIVGLLEAALIINLQHLFHKVVLSIGILLLKIFTLQDGYIDTKANLIGILFVTFFIVLAFIFQEFLSRKNFKERYESQERLKKFESLLSGDFPISVIITTDDFKNKLYSNSFFKNHFREEDDGSTISLDSLFQKFELEANPNTTDSVEELYHTSLCKYFENLHMGKTISENQDLMNISVVCRDNSTHNIEDTATRHYEIKVRKILWETQPAYTIIFNDVSERHMLSALKLADKQKDRIIATVSHELRTPINGTLGLLEMLTERVSDEISQTYLKYCKSCNKLLLYLVNSILDLSQLRHKTLRINKEPFVLKELVEELKSLYVFQCQAKGINFNVETGPGVPREIYTDRYRLIEILINLVGNAVKFTFSGSVTLKIEIDEEGTEKLNFSVVDTGIGVEEQEQPRLFKMFEKVQQKDRNINVQGVGLGLAIVKELVIAINDNDPQEKITLKSEYGRGSLFSFRLNYKRRRSSTITLSVENSKSEFMTHIESFQEHTIISERPLHKMSTYASTNMPTSKNLQSMNVIGKPITSKISVFRTEEEDVMLSNVLVVDDNPLNILAASFILKKFHCRVSKAFNGRDCINELEKSSAQDNPFDLILMDIQMPIMDGPQASKIIQDKISSGKLEYVPIVALTAKVSTPEEIEYYKLCGIKEVLEKPLSQEKLWDILKQHVRQSSRA